MMLSDYLLPLFVFLVSNLAWPGLQVSADNIHRFALWALFKFAILHGVKVKKNILWKISWISWSQLALIEIALIKSIHIEAFI